MTKLYAPTIEPLLQSLLATLADIDFAHERELERIQNASADTTTKQRARSRLIEEHRRRREPYVHQLDLIQRRIRAAMPDAVTERDAA